MLKLDEFQDAMVKSKAKNILGIAGAGSGKTRVLTERIKYLLDELKVPAKNIIAITFTNMAAEEMQARLNDVPCIKEAFIGTIHSLANKIYIKSKKSYQLLTEDVEMLIYEEVLRKYPALSFERYKQYVEQRKLYKFGRITDDEFTSCLNSKEWSVLSDCVPEVHKVIKRDSIITFDELIIEATEYFAQNSIRIQHLLVDELQDIDSEQFKFIMGLKAENNFFVGDDWQSIYGFKGGNVEIFRDLFRKSDFQVYELSNNYRNAREILDLGLNIIDQHPHIIQKDVIGLNKDRGKVKFYERKALHALVDLLKRDKANLRDWFVLTRSNKDLYKLADLLDDNDLDYCFVKKSELTLKELQHALNANQIKLMTVHSAKGLENKKVILYGNFPVVIPHWMKNYDMDERKVMYVGITRAIEELYIFN